jgi:hypothetical protein
MKYINSWNFSVIHWMKHILLASLMFAAIAFAAFLLHLLVHWMEEHGLEPVLVTGLRWVTYFLIVLDCVIFVYYSLSTTVKFLTKIRFSHHLDH